MNDVFCHKIISMTDSNLFTNCNFQGRDYLVKMFTNNTSLELLVTDKRTGEEWQCNYDNLFIENLTHKTGNFKQFDIFVAMIKSGLLKTSSSISLDLLTLEDLQAMRIKRLRSHLTCAHSNICENQNRRYLIVTYSVEFDRIHYPIPLEYCGPPDSAVLQATIARLEEEIENLKQNRNCTDHNKQTFLLEKRIDELTRKNEELRNEIRHLKKSGGSNKASKNEIYMLQKAITNLEKSIMSERKSHHKLVEKLRLEKQYLTKEMERMKENEKMLKSKLARMHYSPPRQFINDLPKYPSKKSDSVHVIYQRNPSPLRKNLSQNQSFKNKQEPSRMNNMGDWNNLNSRKFNRAKSMTSNVVTRSRSSSISSSVRSQCSSARGGAQNVSRKSSAFRNSRSSSISSVDSRSRSKTTAIKQPPPSRIRNTKSSSTQFQNNDLDFEILEERIHVLQKLLNENIKLH